MVLIICVALLVSMAMHANLHGLLQQKDSVVLLLSEVTERSMMS